MFCSWWLSSRSPLLSPSVLVHPRHLHSRHVHAWHVRHIVFPGVWFLSCRGLFLLRSFVAHLHSRHVLHLLLSRDHESTAHDDRHDYQERNALQLHAPPSS